MSREKTDLKSLTYGELCGFFLSIGEKRYRADQFLKRVVSGAESFFEVREFPAALREKLQEVALFSAPGIEKKQVSRDGTVKYLFSLGDRNTVESVVMRYEHGLSICVSTQVGCKMGCIFCASGENGRERNLGPGEILDQIIFAQKDLGERISNIVLMGMGEPLDNFQNVVTFLRIVNHAKGLNIGYRHISLSTCGIADKIKELSTLGFPVTLSVSLHAANDRLRESIMPVNKKYPLGTLIPACREYYAKTKRRISFEYTLLRGVNDAPGHAKELSRLLKGFPCHVNLIGANNVKGKDFQPKNREKLREFAAILEQNGVNATVRRSLGEDIDAACGQLRAKQSRLEGNEF